VPSKPDKGKKEGEGGSLLYYGFVKGNRRGMPGNSSFKEREGNQCLRQGGGKKKRKEGENLSG